ncbi:hypothetical protein [Marimonas lutisalis]|uniref:hypothetical protein n=1 Tax=Marimonas lutisalis TaxID=2545756 RepID=UPI0010F5CFDF|nr:hypothetical protein [Marimonas lutisalis]
MYQHQYGAMRLGKSLRLRLDLRPRDIGLPLVAEYIEGQNCLLPGRIDIFSGDTGFQIEIAPKLPHRTVWLMHLPQRDFSHFKTKA